jgi:SAM-dependent methyltransferase
MQHVSMNIEDKQSLINEFWRILRPGGRLALYEIFAGPKELANFPLPWANTPAISFLADPHQLRSMLRTIGFSVIHWKDVTARTLDWGRRALRWRPDVPPPLGLDLVIGQNAAQKAANLLRNLEESRISLVQVVAERQS